MTGSGLKRRHDETDSPPPGRQARPPRISVAGRDLARRPGGNRTPKSGPVTADTPLSAICRDLRCRLARRARHAVRPKASACRPSRLVRGGSTVENAVGRAAAGLAVGHADGRPRSTPGSTSRTHDRRRQPWPARPGRPRAAPVPRRRLRLVAAVAWRTHRPPPAGAGSVVNRCGGGWSAVADAPSVPGRRNSPRPGDASLGEGAVRGKSACAACAGPAAGWRQSSVIPRAPHPAPHGLNCSNVPPSWPPASAASSLRRRRFSFRTAS